MSADFSDLRQCVSSFVILLAFRVLRLEVLTDTMSREYIPQCGFEGSGSFLGSLLWLFAHVQSKLLPKDNQGSKESSRCCPANPGPIRAGAAGSVPLANATFVVENQSGEVASFTTNGQGGFRASLPPGHYKVSLKGRKSSIGRFGPFEVDVVSGKMTNVQWECDSGIR